MANRDVKTGAYGTLVGLNSKKPWLPPATLTLKGSTCLDANNSDPSAPNRCQVSSSVPLPNQILNLCISLLKSNLTLGAARCSQVSTGSDGSFTISQRIASLPPEGIHWSLSGSYLGLPLQDAEGSHPAQASGELRLPVQPPTPLTAAQIKARNLALYNLGVQVMSGFTSSELSQVGFDAFFSPGRSTLTQAQAQDFCRKLPTVVSNLSSRVGLLAYTDINYLNGCVSVAVKVKRQ